MKMSDDSEEKQESAGLPGWVMTFADLMTLLMCFFVLLLAFSEMDAAKFKQLSGSMKNAFGVQAEVEVRTIPKGTSVVAQEFSPGKPEPTALNEIRQFTINSNLSTLDAVEKIKRDKDATADHVSRIRLALREEIENGSVSVQAEGAKIIIQILEKASFESGYADVRADFVPVLGKISRLIDRNVGLVTISGHTDNVPISNGRFRSNWDLSTSRAVSVAHEMLKNKDLDPARFMVTGHADTRPRADNDTAENRAKNRRVEISIIRGLERDEEREVSVEAGVPSETAAKETTS
jgi:chemotaxis protein MotB